MNITIVTAGIILKDEKVLIAQRKGDVNQGLKWEFPGGKLEENETPKEGLAREIKEELDIIIEVGEIYEVVYHKYPNITILLLCYLAKYSSGTIKAMDCNDFKWIDVKDLEKYNMSDADRIIRQKILLKGVPY